jgi:group I intron endonuclease
LASVNLYLRSCQHFSDLRKNIHKNPHLQSAWNKYGESNFRFIVLEECPQEELLKKEDEWIGIKNSLDRNFGFNLKEAQRPLHSKETCKKISEGKMGSKNPMYGKKLSEERKKKIGEAAKIFMMGRHPSIESRLKMSKSQTGKILSEETKRKIGIASKGRIKSEETRRKLSEAQSGAKAWNYGKHHSEETKRKIGSGNTGKKHTEESKRKMSESKSGEKT